MLNSPIFFIKTLRSLGKVPAVLIFLSLVPKFLWPLILNMNGGHYVDWPLTYHRRFIWIKDAIESDTLVKEMSKNWFAFLHSLPITWTVILLILVALGAYSLMSSPSIGNLTRVQEIRDSALVLGIYSAGIVLNGENGPRFTTGITLLFGLIILKNAGKAKSVPRYWWIPYLVIFSLNSWYWVSN